MTARTTGRAAARTSPPPQPRARRSPAWATGAVGLVGAAALGVLLVAGGELGRLVAAVLVVVLLGVALQQRRSTLLPLLALTVACLPSLVWFPFLVTVGGKSLFFTDLLLPAATLLALARPSRTPRTDLVVWAYVAVMGLQTLVGVVEGQPFNAFTQDLRGPAYIVCGYFVASRLYTRAVDRQVVGAAGFVLWYSAALMLVTIATGVDVLAGRTEDVRAYETGGAQVIDATRFIVDSKGLAFVTLVTAGTVLLSRRSSAAQRRVAAVLVVPALTVSFLNYARATLLALAVCVVLLVVLHRLARVHGRRLVVGGVAVAVFVGLVGLTGTVGVFSDPQGNVLARQVAGFEERVLGGLGSEGVEAPGNTYRLLENGYALRAFAENPLFGQGVGAVFKPRSFGDPALDAFQTDPEFGVRFIHNGWLWYLVKGGVVGLAAFLALVLVPVLRYVRRAWADGSARPADVGIAVSIAGLLAIFVFEPDIHRTGTAPLVGAALGYLALLGTRRPRERHAPRGTDTRDHVPQTAREQEST